MAHGSGDGRVRGPVPSRVTRLRWLVLGVCGLMGLFLAGLSTTVLSSTSVPMTMLSIRSSTEVTAEVKAVPRPALLRSMASPDAGPTGERGIVLCLHEGIVAMGVSLIRELRCLGNDEPIQVYHCLPDELSPASQALLTRGDPKVEIIDVCTALLDDPAVFDGNLERARAFRGYWIKPLAMYHTRLAEPILLDADVLLLEDPARLRTMSGYNRTGTTFFHDRIASMRKFFNAQQDDGEQLLHYLIRTFDYARFGLPGGPRPSAYLQQSFAYRQETGHEMDSSMVALDKTRAGRALEILKYLSLELRFKHNFSWGDKEAFWLAYEFAQQDYFFSPWGLSLVDSVPNGDLRDHPTTLCGSMAHFLPTEDDESPAEVLYVNGKALLDPFSMGLEQLPRSEKSRWFNVNPTHVTPRYRSSTFDLSSRKTFECMDDLGAVELPPLFHRRLQERRRHYFAAQTKVYEALDHCGV